MYVELFNVTFSPSFRPFLHYTYIYVYVLYWFINNVNDFMTFRQPIIVIINVSKQEKKYFI